MFIILVSDQSFTTLVTVVKEQSKPGMPVMSDCWNSYKYLNEERYKHLAINHKMNFVDTDNGAHT